MPWLQYYNPDIAHHADHGHGHAVRDGWRSCPTAWPRLMAAYIGENKLQLGRDIVFLISADANHYGRDFNNIPYGEDKKAHAQGIEQDRRIAWPRSTAPLDDRKDPSG